MGAERQGRRPLASAALALLVAGLGAMGARAGILEVQIKLQMPQKIDVTGVRRVLVAGFRANDNPDLDIDVEYRKHLKSLLKHRSNFEVIDADPPPLPEQEPAEIVKNAAYWKRLGERFSADLILAGLVDFDKSNKSGFVQEDIINPTTGQRYRRTRYADREGFKLGATHYFFRGATGELVYEGRLTEEVMYEGLGNDSLNALLQLAERMSPDLLGVVTPRERSETRYLLTE
ncbi:MAG: hypothetical protein HY049_18585 [Acidobacteria bacterium]|nr:hypothetical protein [Acidobacteriota bacterium]